MNGHDENHNDMQHVPQLQTYTAGEDKGRLAQVALSLGLDTHRRPRKQVRNRENVRELGLDQGSMKTLFNNVGFLFADNTLEGRMHAIGIYDDEEELEEYERVPIRTSTSDEPTGLNALIQRMEQGEEGASRGDDGHGGGAGGTLSAAVFGIIKGMVGPAILYLPRGFADSGYAFAFPAIFVAVLMFLYSSERLLACWKSEMRKKIERAIEISAKEVAKPKSKVVTGKNGTYGSVQTSETSSYPSSRPQTPEMMKSLLKHVEEHVEHAGITSSDPVKEKKISIVENGIAIENATKARQPKIIRQKSDRVSRHITYPELAHRAFGEMGEQVIMNGIAFMQLGVCLTYFIFVPQNLHTSIRVLYNVNLPMWFYLILMVLIEIPLSWIRNIRKLTLTNVLANFLILFGLISCLYFALVAPGYDPTNTGHHQNLIQKLSHLEPINDHWFLFIGTAVLLFEGSITLCIPLQDAVDGHKRRSQFPKVYKRTISGIIVFYCFFGTICWSAFGPTVKTVLTTSLPDGILATSVQLAYSLAVIFTFPLQAFPAHEIICRIAKRYVTWPQKTMTSFERNIITSSVVIVLSIVAVIEMDSLGHVVSLMGSLLGCPIAFVFPPLIHNKLVPDSPLSTKVLNYLVAGLGILAAVGASFTTLATWNEEGAG